MSVPKKKKSKESISASSLSSFHMNLVSASDPPLRNEGASAASEQDHRPEYQSK